MKRMIYMDRTICCTILNKLHFITQCTEGWDCPIIAAARHNNAVGRRQHLHFDQAASIKHEHVSFQLTAFHIGNAFVRCKEDLYGHLILSRSFPATQPLWESDGAVFNCSDKEQVQRIQCTTLTCHIQGKLSVAILQSPVHDSVLKCKSFVPFGLPAA